MKKIRWVIRDRHMVDFVWGFSSLPSMHQAILEVMGPSLRKRRYTCRIGDFYAEEFK